MDEKTLDNLREKAKTIEEITKRPYGLWRRMAVDGVWGPGLDEDSLTIRIGCDYYMATHYGRLEDSEFRKRNLRRKLGAYWKQYAEAKRNKTREEDVRFASWKEEFYG